MVCISVVTPSLFCSLILLPQLFLAPLLVLIWRILAALVMLLNQEKKALVGQRLVIYALVRFCSVIINSEPRIVCPIYDGGSPVPPSVRDTCFYMNCSYCGWSWVHLLHTWWSEEVAIFWSFNSLYAVLVFFANTWRMEMSAEALLVAPRGGF